MVLTRTRNGTELERDPSILETSRSHLHLTCSFSRKYLCRPVGPILHCQTRHYRPWLSVTVRTVLVIMIPIIDLHVAYNTAHVCANQIRKKKNNSEIYIHTRITNASRPTLSLSLSASSVAVYVGIPNLNSELINFGEFLYQINNLQLI